MTTRLLRNCNDLDPRPPRGMRVLRACRERLEFAGSFQDAFTLLIRAGSRRFSIDWMIKRLKHFEKLLIQCGKRRFVDLEQEDDLVG